MIRSIQLTSRDVTFTTDVNEMEDGLEKRKQEYWLIGRHGTEPIGLLEVHD